MLEVKDSGSFNSFKVNSGEYPTPEVLNRPALGMLNNDLVLESAAMMTARSGGTQFITDKTKFLCHFNETTKDSVGNIYSSTEAEGNIVNGLVQDNMFNGVYYAQDSATNLVHNNTSIDSSLNTLSGWTVAGDKTSNVSIVSNATGTTVDNSFLKTSHALYSDVFAPGYITLTSSTYAISGSATSITLNVNTDDNLKYLGIEIVLSISFYHNSTYISTVSVSTSDTNFNGMLRLKNISTPATANGAKCEIRINYSHVQSSSVPSVASILLNNFMHASGSMCKSYTYNTSSANYLTYNNVINGSKDFSVFSWIYFDGEQINNYSSNYGPIFIEPNLGKTAGYIDYTFTALATAGDTIEINDIVYTWVSSGATGTNVNVGTNLSILATNFGNALTSTASIADYYTIAVVGSKVSLTEKIIANGDTPSAAITTGSVGITSTNQKYSSNNAIGIRHLSSDLGTGAFVISASSKLCGTKAVLSQSDYNNYRPCMLRSKTVDSITTVDLLIMLSDYTVVKSTLTNLHMSSDTYNIIIGKDPQEVEVDSYFNGGITELRYDEEWLNDAQFNMLALNTLPFRAKYNDVDLSWYKPGINLIKNPDGKLGKNFWTGYTSKFNSVVEDTTIGSGFTWNSTSAESSDVSCQNILLSGGVPLSFSGNISTSSDTTGTVGIKLNFYSDTAGTVYLGYSSLQASSTDVTNYTIKAVTPTGTKSVRAILWILNATSSKVTWSKLKLEYGIYSTTFTDDYTPAYAVYAE